MGASHEPNMAHLARLSCLDAGRGGNCPISGQSGSWHSEPLTLLPSFPCVYWEASGPKNLLGGCLSINPWTMISCWVARLELEFGSTCTVAVRVLGCKPQTQSLPIFSKREFIGRMWMGLKELMGSWSSKFGDRQESRRDGGPRIRLQAHVCLSAAPTTMMNDL